MCPEYSVTYVPEAQQQDQHLYYSLTQPIRRRKTDFCGNLWEFLVLTHFLRRRDQGWQAPAPSSAS